MSGVSEYSTTASSNTPAGTASIRTGDNDIRQMKADIAAYTRAGADLASASTLDLDSIDSLWLAVTGTTTVTAVTLTEGHTRHVRATGAFQITAGASLIVNGSTTVNYTTTAGDLLFFEGYGSSVVRVWVLSTFSFARMSLLATQATTSGDTKSFAIPAWAKKITVNLVGVSTDGSFTPFVRLGVGGVAETTGYLGAVNNGDTAAANANFSSSFNDNAASASIVRHGAYELTLADEATNTWVCRFGIGFSNDSGVRQGYGSKALAGPLDTIFYGTSNIFDAGFVSVLVEG